MSLNIEEEIEEERNDGEIDPVVCLISFLKDSSAKVELSCYDGSLTADSPGLDRGA